MMHAIFSWSVGHGRSQGNRDDVKSIDTYVDDIVNHIDKTREEFGELPVFLMGHSDVSWHN